MTSALAESLKRAADFSVALEKLKSHMFEDWQKQAEASKAASARLIVDFHKAYQNALAIFNSGVDMTIEKVTQMTEVRVTALVSQ
jgi:hypothetical protein